VTSILAFFILAVPALADEPHVHRDIPYAEPKNERQTLEPTKELFEFVMGVLGKGQNQTTSETTAGWVKYSSNPVLGGGLGTCFDVSVLEEDETYRMWFSWRPNGIPGSGACPDRRCTIQGRHHRLATSSR